jgi:ribosomal 50S subunit-associated protein YjgA (DUF615 family)
MKNLTIAVLCMLAFACGALAQNSAKGMKALEAKDYAGAFAEFDAALKSDPDDLIAHFGMSKLHGIEASGKKDKALALEHLLAAEAGWAKLDEKSKAKVQKAGISQADMEERRNRVESSYLEAAKAENTVAAYNVFLEKFPASKSAESAANYRNNMAWVEAQEDGSIEALSNFINKYPDAAEVKECKKQRNEMATAAALKDGSEPALEDFLAKYPDAIQAPQIRQRLNAVAFENAKASNSVEKMRLYIEKHPDSVFLTQAKELLEWLEQQAEK